MDYYSLNMGGLKRDLPIVSISPKIKIASFNLLGDNEMVEVIAKLMKQKLSGVGFDYLVGPEVKVVPLLYELSRLLNKDKYMVCRKQIHGYMVSPISSVVKPGLVMDGADAKLLKEKKVVVVDDVVSSGRTMKVMDDLMNIVGAKIVAHIAVFRQGNKDDIRLNNLIHLGELPLFTS